MTATGPGPFLGGAVRQGAGAGEDDEAPSPVLAPASARPAHSRPCIRHPGPRPPRAHNAGGLEQTPGTVNSGGSLSASAP